MVSAVSLLYLSLVIKPYARSQQHSLRISFELCVFDTMCRAVWYSRTEGSAAQLYPDKGGSSETSVPLCQTTRCHILYDRRPKTQHRQKIRHGQFHCPATAHGILPNATFCSVGVFLLRSAAFTAETCCAAEPHFKY